MRVREQERKMCCVSHLGVPSLIFIGVNEVVSGRQSRGHMQNRLLEVTRGRYVEAGGEGARGSLAELGVRPTPSHRLWPSNLSGRLVSGPLCWLHVSHVELKRFWSCL
jgi:hypothetical protein